MKGKVRHPVPFALVIVAALCLSRWDSYQSQTKVLAHKQERTAPGPDSVLIHLDLVNVLFTVTDRKANW
jgi:hypothetical protein